MLKNTLTPLLGLSFSTAPVAVPVLASGTPAAGPDPQAMMLLWYAVVGIMGILSAAGTIIAFLEWRDKRAEREEAKRERAAAEGKGGLVTYETLLNELKQVYANMQRDDLKLREDIMGELDGISQSLKELRAGLQAAHSKHERLEGQLNPLPVFTPPGPRTRNPGAH